MQPDVVKVMQECTEASDQERITFPEVVMKLMQAGVERYHADLLRADKIYYLPSGESHRVRRSSRARRSYTGRNWSAAATMVGEPAAVPPPVNSVVPGLDIVQAGDLGTARGIFVGLPDYVQRCGHTARTARVIGWTVIDQASADVAVATAQVSAAIDSSFLSSARNMLALLTQITTQTAPAPKLVTPPRASSSAGVLVGRTARLIRSMA